MVLITYYNELVTGAYNYGLLYAHNSIVYYTQITILHGGESKPSYNWGHIVQMVNFHEFSMKIM